MFVPKDASAVYFGVLLAMGGGAAVNATVNGITGFTEASPKYAYDQTTATCFVRVDGVFRVGDTDPLPCTEKIIARAKEQGNIFGNDGPG
jgi:hypothetical protein